MNDTFDTEIEIKHFELQKENEMGFKNICGITAIGLALFITINNSSASDRSVAAPEREMQKVDRVVPADQVSRSEAVDAMQKLIDAARKAASSIRKEIKKFQARTNHRGVSADINRFLHLAKKYDELADMAERERDALGKSFGPITRKRIKWFEDAAKDVEDDQSMVQFKIQMATSDLQNAENVRSQAEKRLEQQKKDLTRNWAG